VAAKKILQWELYQFGFKMGFVIIAKYYVGYETDDLPTQHSAIITFIIKYTLF
jgi:hypothetical protein